MSYKINSIFFATLLFVTFVKPSFSEEKHGTIQLLIPIIKHFEFPVQLFQISTLCIYQYESLKDANPRVTKNYCDYWKSLTYQTMNHIKHDIDLKKNPSEYWDLIQK